MDSQTTEPLDSEEFKELKKVLDGIKYEGNLVNLSDDKFVIYMPADNFNRIMKEEAEKFIKQLDKTK